MPGTYGWSERSLIIHFRVVLICIHESQWSWHLNDVRKPYQKGILPLWGCSQWQVLLLYSQSPDTGSIFNIANLLGGTPDTLTILPSLTSSHHFCSLSFLMMLQRSHHLVSQEWDGVCPSATVARYKYSFFLSLEYQTLHSLALWNSMEKVEIFISEKSFQAFLPQCTYPHGSLRDNLNLFHLHL